MGSVLKIAALVLVLGSLGVTGYLAWDFQSHVSQLPTRQVASLAPSEEPAHGEKAADGHGEVKAEGGHGEAAPAEGHGGGHGEAAAAKPTKEDGIPLVSFDEIFVNVGGSEGPVRSLGVKIELELFNEKDNTFLEERKKGIQDAIIQSSREQDFQRLSTVQGKLYFKELLAARINQFLNQPTVREVHFSSFFLQ